MLGCKLRLFTSSGFFRFFREMIQDLFAEKKLGGLPYFTTINILNISGLLFLKKLL